MATHPLTVEQHIHRCKNWFSRLGRFCYTLASTSLIVAHWQYALWGLRNANGRTTVARTANTQHLVFCANLHTNSQVCSSFSVALAVCYWLSDHWHIAALTEAELYENPPNLENRTVRTVAWDGRFLNRKRVRDPKFRPNLPLHGLISTTISWHCHFKEKKVFIMRYQYFSY
jgi:hypothetical protein